MTTLRYNVRTAKRDHERRCYLSGLPIEKGDRYFEGVTVDGRDFWYMKGHSVLAEIAQSESKESFDEGWDPGRALEYLASFIRRHLGAEEHWEDMRGWVNEPEVQECVDHAAWYWMTKEGV